MAVEVASAPNIESSTSENAEVKHHTIVEDPVAAGGEVATVDGEHPRPRKPNNNVLLPNGDHPLEADIIEQVEYYFSDDNLLLDSHLKEMMKGDAKNAVSIKSLCGFPRMRQYRPLTAVVRSLTKSALLQVIQPGNLIKRKIPFTWPDSDDEDSDYEIRRQKQAEQEQRCKWKQKREIRNIVTAPVVDPNSGMTKAMLRPSGFEDYYTDAPVTPAEYERERTLYDPDESFTERIETAIRRFAARRKFQAQSRDVFSKFLKYGGVEAQSHAFGGGLTKEDKEGMTKEEILAARCDYSVGNDKSEEDGDFVVDFEGVAKGFLSSMLPDLFAPSAYHLAFKILPNFYRYLLHHDVAHPSREPELVASIGRAISVCALAAKELPLAADAGLALPGEFNVALSVLTGGFYDGMYVGDASWAKESGAKVFGDEMFGGGGTEIGMETKKAKVVALTGLSAYADEEMWGKIAEKGAEWHKHFAVLEKVEHKRLQVVRVEMAGEGVAKVYGAPNMVKVDADEGGTVQQQIAKKVELKRLGKLVCTDWEFDDFIVYDRPASTTSRSGSNSAESEKAREYTFFIEDAILSTTFVGMKLAANIRRLGYGAGACEYETCGKTHDSAKEAGGLWQMDKIISAHCSFMTCLPNEFFPKKWTPPTLFEEEERERERAKEMAGGNGDETIEGADED